jgi:phage host-nuclease inhibitor protein Gam
VILPKKSNFILALRQQRVQGRNVTQHERLMAMSKEQLLQAYEDLQEAHARVMSSFNSTTSNMEHEFAITKANLEAEITALKAEIQQ